MPFIDLRTTVPTAPQQREALKTAFGQAITALHKTETYLMVSIQDNSELWLGGQKLDKGAFVAVSLYGLRLGFRLQPDDRPCLPHPVRAAGYTPESRLCHLPPRQRLGLERPQFLIFPGCPVFGRGRPFLSPRPHTKQCGGRPYGRPPQRDPIFRDAKVLLFWCDQQQKEYGSIPLCRHIGWVFYPSVQVVSGTRSPLISSPGMVPRGCYK